MGGINPLPLILGTAGTMLGGPAGTALGIGSTVGGAVGGGLGSAAGSAISRRGSPLSAGLMGVAGGLASPLLKNLLPESLKDVLGMVPDVKGAPEGLAGAVGTEATEKALFGPNWPSGGPGMGLKEATLPATPSATSAPSAGAALSALPQPSVNASPSSSRLAMLEELRRRFV